MSYKGIFAIADAQNLKPEQIEICIAFFLKILMKKYLLSTKTRV